MSGDTIKLKALFKASFDENEGMRSVAATKQYRYMVANDLHPDDIIIERRGESQERASRIIAVHEALIAKLQRQIAFYEQHGDAKIRALAAKAGLVENRWAEFQKVAECRFPGKLARGWKVLAISMLGINKKCLRDWEVGLSRIPDSAIETLRTASIPERKPQVRKSSISRLSTQIPQLNSKSISKQASINLRTDEV